MALDVDLVVANHHDFGDLVVAQQLFEWSVSQDVVDDLLHQASSFAVGERVGIAIDDHRNRLEDDGLQCVGVEVSGVEASTHELLQDVIDLISDANVVEPILSLGSDDSERSGVRIRDRLGFRFGPI